MDGMEGAVKTLKKLKQLGVTLAIDDFGTGYSSLSYLKHLPVDNLKIDKSFVAELAVNTADAAIVQSVVGLGKSLGLSITGEGIETAAQGRRLFQFGCDRGQGYFFSEALSADDLTRLLAEHSSRRSSRAA
jgi:EAL domain-containing protein (putative c-di-GMP-specific phosphodiesterase class I)